ncbi:hypothetical protein LguiA_034559 [Lonicera macranthoides]
MSFGGFFGSSSGGSANNPYSNNTNMLTASISQPQMITPPIAQPMFNSPALSLALKPKMEGLGEMGMIMENFDPSGVMTRIKEDEYESRSGSDNFEGGSGDEQDTTANKRKKKYHRHTPYQIQELEASFKENPHPDEKGRLELGKKLGLESKQVKFWFQNRRTQMKTQIERHENLLLKQENDKLRVENIAIKEAIRSPICSTCGGQAILGEISIEEHHLRIENARLRDELNRVCVLANKFLGKPLSSITGPVVPHTMSNTSLELAVGTRNGFGGFGPVDSTLPMGFDFGINGVSNALNMVPQTRPVDVPIESYLPERALGAMDELLKLAQIDNPLWFKSFDGVGETLNHEEYLRTFPPCIGPKPNGFITDATRAVGTVLVNSLALVEMLMDSNRWAEMFPGIIGRTSTINVLSSGMGGTRNGALQLMQAEIQIISPLVPVRAVKFLRYCKQHAEGVWAVVDVSIHIPESSNAHSSVYYRRLPSGCIVQDMPNSYPKVTWIEHSEYDEAVVHDLYRPLLRSGMGFGAQRWLATLQRQCECLAAVMSSTVPSEDNPVITPNGRRSVAKLAQRMTQDFCAGVCATVHQWEVVRVGSMGEDAVRLMTRKGGVNNIPGEPNRVVSATMSVWMPVQHQHLFELLQNEQLRSQWDFLSNGGPMQQVVRIAKSQDQGNCISLLRASATANNANSNNMLILQETSSNSSGSLIVYAAVDIPAMNVVMNGGDSDCVAFLPSGFSIVADCFPNSGGDNTTDGGTLPKEGGGSVGNGNSHGSLLTVGFQILVNSLPDARLTMESVDTVNALISRTVQGIKEALHCN